LLTAHYQPIAVIDNRMAGHVGSMSSWLASPTSNA